MWMEFTDNNCSLFSYKGFLQSNVPVAMTTYNGSDVKSHQQLEERGESMRVWRLLSHLIGLDGVIIVHSHVAFHVQGQVVGPGERPLTEVALERPVARVFAVVPRELI